ncbi:MAG: N4-gp56 family major capsid protein, partial [Thermoprotei archaeon]
MSSSAAFNTSTNDSERIYGDGTDSSIGPQINTYYYDKKALIEIAKVQFFGQLADTTSMSKHMGKKLKKYLYLPLLDDRNINDQGIDATGATITNGNLYGSSKDIGSISGKIPTLTEHGGRVNRVGFKRVEVEGTMAKFGFFDEYSQESIDFDTDAQLQMHIRRESTRGANEITEAQLQIDLLNAAGVIRFGGAATQNSEITGESAGVISVPTYEGLMKLGITLDENKSPKSTKVITGSRLIDTKTIDNARYMYIGSEMIPTLRRMKDLHNEKAFVDARHYAAAGTLAKGEIGAIDQFRFILVPEMFHWAGAGATETAGNAGYRATGSAYDIFPMLCVGSDSFTTIGFQTNGKKVKWKINHKAPSDNVNTLDPYGETGFYSIKWYYGFMAQRPE